MAIDQRDITSQLRMMDDRALQQYAAMHKSDPYVFPLAFQESQNRQRVRMSGQAQMAGQEMPKVNDAALMAMSPQAAPPQAPQAQGISNLPAPNMQRMADGGIAGYEDDEEGMATGGMGGMFNFAQQSEPVVRMAGGGHIPRYQGVPIDAGGDGSVVDEFKGIDDQIAANMERQRLLGAFDEYSKYTPTPKKGSKAAKKLEEEAKKEAKKEEPVKKPELPALPTYTPKTAAQGRAEVDKIIAPDLAEIKESYKPFAEQFAQDRSRIEGREKNMLSDALIRGGLKTMAGKSQFAMQNIGEGGLEALNVYQETQKTNDAARKALTQSEMLMSQAQRADERGARGEAVSLFAQAQKDQQVGLQLQQKAQELASTEKFQQGSLLVAQQNAITASRNADANMVAARNRGVGAGAMALSREAQLQLNAAKLELADISKQLEKDIRLNLPKNAEAKARLETRRNQLRADIAKLGGSDTISEIPLAGSGSGDKVLDFAKI
jgi:nucleotide-binding universal stress UspA family protein